MKYKTLTEAFLDIDNYDKTHNFIIDKETELNISSREYKSRVLKILNYLQMKGIKEGDEIVFQVKSNVNFTQIFWACILGKFIPVPYVYLEYEREKFKLINIWKTLNNPVLVTDNQTYKKVVEFINKNNLSELKNIKDNVILTEYMDNQRESDNIKYSDETDIAFIQFSSGSTSEPKGVIITHKNILSSIDSTAKAMNITQEDVFLSWLPLTHSFGLIAGYLMPFIIGFQYYNMPSKLFVSNPILWIEKMSEHKVTMSAAPNFAYKHVCKMLKFYKNKNLDLSNLRRIINGAEPVSVSVCEKFNMDMAEFGLKETVVCPSYGLSEATLVVSTPREDKKFVEVNVLRNNVAMANKVIEIEEKKDNSVSFVEVGKVLDGIDIKIVDDDGNELEDRVVGNVLLKGDMIFSGYYNNDYETNKVLDEFGWYNTGDLGFIRADNLVITGRVKDVIFVNGENFYSHDIENICQEVCDNEFDRVAICGVYNAELNQDQVVCFLEYNGDISQFDKIAIRIKKHIVKKTGIGIAEVIAVNKIPVTGSGKIKHYILSQKFMNNEFNEFLITK